MPANCMRKGVKSRENLRQYCRSGSSAVAQKFADGRPIRDVFVQSYRRAPIALHRAIAVCEALETLDGGGAKHAPAHPIAGIVGEELRTLVEARRPSRSRASR